jgi:hypothetical protein
VMSVADLKDTLAGVDEGDSQGEEYTSNESLSDEYEYETPPAPEPVKYTPPPPQQLQQPPKYNAVKEPTKSSVSSRFRDNAKKDLPF